MKYVIVGAGAVGLSLADELAKRGNEIQLASRNRPAQPTFPAGVTFTQIDIHSVDDLDPLCQGADCIIQAAGFSPDRAPAELPPLINALIGTAARSKASLICIDSMGAYGDNLGIPMSEATPERPTCMDEALRADMARLVLDAHRQGNLQALVARCCTLYGPRVTKSPLGEAVFAPVVAGKAARMIGRLDMPHAFTYVKDLARSVAILSEHDEAWGQVWHVPCPQPITQQQVLDILRDMVSRTVTADTIGSRFLGLKSVFDPSLKQFGDLMYRFEKPYVVNHSRFSTTFGERTTFHTQALFETLEWYKQRVGIARRFGV